MTTFTKPKPSKGDIFTNVFCLIMAAAAIYGIYHFIPQI